MVQKHIIVSMIALVAIAGILIMAALANQAYSRPVSHSVECKITKGGPQECVTTTHHERSESAAGATTQPSNAGNGRPAAIFVHNPPTSSQQSSNTATTVKCINGYARIG